MSSLPFSLGLPVVDRLTPNEMQCVLRTKSRKELELEIRRIQGLLTDKDLIKVYPIGYRPDKPVPTSAYFSEVHITIGNAEEWVYGLGLFSGAWWNVVTGRIKAG